MKVLTLQTAVISQVDMGNVRTYENSIRRLERARNRVLESILEKYQAGAAVEPGSHDLEVVEEIEGGVKKLIVRVL